MEGGGRVRRVGRGLSEVGGVSEAYMFFVDGDRWPVGVDLRLCRARWARGVFGEQWIFGVA